MNYYDKFKLGILTNLKMYIETKKKELETRGFIPTLDMVIEDIEKEIADIDKQGDETPESVDAVEGVGDEPQSSEK